MKRVSGKYLCKRLKKLGWEHARTTGSHHIFKPPTHLSHLEQVTVPVHGNKTLKLGTQIAIMKDAEMTESDL